MQVKIPHQGTEEQAIAHIKTLLEENRSKITEQATDVTEKWEGNVLHFGFTTNGATINGTLTVRDKEYELYAKLPFALRLFEGRIEKMIQQEAKKLNL
jgi:hypothetical protein